MKKLTIVIVSYNVRHYLEQCIDSVLRATRNIDCEICVVDNSSSDDTIAVLAERFAGKISLTESLSNLGFARANNIAIRQTESEYVLLLNPDTFISEECLDTTIAFMDEHPRAGGVGVMMHNADGTRAMESRRGLPTPWVALKKMFGLSSQYYMSHLPWDTAGKIEAMSGAFCMLRREALHQVGLLDEDFFMYGEDIDLSYRILKGGWENWYVPAKIVHYKGESTQKTSYRYVHTFYQAMLIFFRKHYGHLSLLITLPVKLAILLRAMLALLTMLYWRVCQYLGSTGSTPKATYCFVGSSEMLDECRGLAVKRGLEAEFCTLGEMQQGKDILHANPTCVVYDTDSIPFSQVIDMAEGMAGKGVTIGTYSRQSKTILTQREIIR